MLTQDTTQAAEMAAMQDLRQVERAVQSVGRRVLAEASCGGLSDDARDRLAIQLEACGVTLAAASTAADEPTCGDGFVTLARLVRGGEFPDLAFALMSCGPSL